MKKLLTVLLGILWMGVAIGQENAVVDTTVFNAHIDTNAQIVGGNITQEVKWLADADLELLPADSTGAFLLVSATTDSTALTRSATFTLPAQVDKWRHTDESESVSRRQCVGSDAR